MDPLSQLLALSNIEGAVSAELRAGGDWAIAFHGQRHVKFGVVVSGSCWLTADDLAEPIRLGPGDCYLVVGGRDYQLASDLNLPPVRSDLVWTGGEPIAVVGSGRDARLIGGRLFFDRPNASLLVNALPPVVHLPSDSGEAGVLSETIRLLTYETEQARPGQSLMLEQLARILLMQGLRARPAVSAEAEPGIEKALAMIHDDAARTWSIDELARAATMSRSTFAGKFKAAVGESPGRYMLYLRMHSAKQILLNTGRTISSVATEWGYGSEAAFSAAFKRIMGASPRKYRE
ncbi:AraC family transcriptional regulator [Actinoplanes sp. TBRC 11911]|uniref:AraC family transcriptional regulator n=1 Tax=Actinoplanes sp. TBRC 11911 TaxID=2729386 RepID=UPI00145D77DC|nr:AraC family transcriptional regulator [Actinoplanes sp. TBRC 11911]NMO55264.1 AraC family transcriptional regulator [Actinoplanes sp. TBRC 11911]